MKKYVVAISFSIFCHALMSTTWYVAASGGSDSNNGKSESAAFKTIQKAANSAANGDTILVGSGRYVPSSTSNYGVINSTKKLKIKSINGYSSTVIDAKKQMCCLYEGGNYNYTNCVLIGFTLINGSSPSNFNMGGGAIGGTLVNCVVSNCFAKANAGAGHFTHFVNCVLAKNWTTEGYASAAYSGELINCTIVGNYIKGSLAGGQCAAYNCTLRNCIMWKNLSSGNSVVTTYGICTTSKCCTSDPKFVSEGKGDYRLSANSPCINAGGNSYNTWSTDLAGKARKNGTIDIGAFEYYPTTYTVNSIEAVQWYPWNGMVDVSMMLSCTETVGNQTVAMVATDTVGGTNVTCKSFVVNGLAKTSLSLPMGTSTIQWDAVKDLPAGFNSSLTIKATCNSASKTSSAFKLDLRGLGPWQNRVAAANETIVYSPAWATNGGANAQAVVKVAKARRTKPRYIAIDLSGGTTAKHYPVEYLDEIPGGSWSDVYKTSKLVLRHIPAGSFIMGRRNTDYPGAVNTNLHMVTITKDFYMGVFEVTQRQWELVMGSVDACFTNKSCYMTRPMDKVGYRDIRGYEKGMTWPETRDVDDGCFLSLIRERTGMVGFDLPTEAQWEYSCRAGSTAGLSNGKNVTMLNALCDNVSEVARYMWNSGRSDYGDQVTAYNALANSDVSRGTAAVGSYVPNAWELYDMHGNVFEFCLDVWSENKSQSVDPVGVGSTITSARTIRGGSWSTEPKECLSGWNYSYHGNGHLNASARGTVGFRLCLQGGEIPEVADSATEVVMSAAAGTKSWTPTEAGTYIWTHEVTNANGVVKLDSARFTVGGPTLTLEPQGDLEKGVGVAVNGAWDGWQVYYTLDGSSPTTNSAAYAGAVTMNESGTLRAIAYSDSAKMYSEEVRGDFTLSDAFGLVGAVARPRYPWNGKVDIDVEVKGEAGRDYIVSLIAQDLDGGTNLPVRTVAGRRDPSPPQSPENEITLNCGSGAQGSARPTAVLRPGHYRFVWNADADIAHDFDFARVAVKVTGEASKLAGYRRVMTLSVNDAWAPAVALTNVPTLVRLSTAITGFDYNDFASPSNGADLVFLDSNDNCLPYEIDEWHTNGESLVWVKLPELKRGTTFTAAWGCPNTAHCTLNSKLSPHEVWRDYAGVWHMNEDSGTAFDSTEHHLDGIPSCGANGDASTIAQMVRNETGACGGARVNSIKKSGRGNDKENFMLVPSYDALGLGSTFVISGWFKGVYWNDGTTWYPDLFSRKMNGNEDAGVCIAYRDFGYSVVGDNFLSDESQGKWFGVYEDGLDDWKQLLFVFGNTNCKVYINGLPYAEKGPIPVSDNGCCLGIGNSPVGGTWSFVGQYDEIRLRGGTLSPERIKADYDMIKQPAFLEYRMETVR